MQKAIVIFLLCFILGIIEFVLYNFLGRWFMPNLLLLFVIFINLYLGIRYSIFTAVISGIIRDSWSISIFGIHLFAFVLTAFLITIIQRYIYRRGSGILRLVLVFVIMIVNFIIYWALNFMFAQVNFIQAFNYILVPQLLVTLVVATRTFYLFKQCVSKFSV